MTHYTITAVRAVTHLRVARIAEKLFSSRC